MSVRSMVRGGVQERWRVPCTGSPVSPGTLPGGPTGIIQCYVLVEIAETTSHTRNIIIIQAG